MKWDGGWLQREGVPGVAKLMLCDHIITLRHTLPGVPIMILQSSGLGSVKHIGFQIQALSDAECQFEIEAWGLCTITDFLDILHGSGIYNAVAGWWYIYRGGTRRWPMGGFS